MGSFKRSIDNPVLMPNPQNYWEAEGAFNGCPILHSERIHFLYRAVSRPQEIRGKRLNISSIGHALSTDGVHFKYRRQFIKPEFEWELFGCEDPRVTRIGSKFYIFYTALSDYPFSADNIRIGLVITEDFQRIEAKYPVTNFNSKAMALFPSRIDGKIAAVLSVNTDKPPAKIGLAIFDRDEQIWSPEYWEGWYSFLDDHVLPLQRSEEDHIEVGAPPIRTPSGWLLIYSYISNYFSPPADFGIEGVLLDLEDPSHVLARTRESWIIPEEFYEKYGKVPGVVFPSGAYIRHGKVHLYYGAADTTCALASATLNSVIEEIMMAKMEAVSLKRYSGNPVLRPIPEIPWEAKAVFNPGVIYENGKVHLFYRAMSEDNTSVIGYAASKDGYIFDETYDEPVYTPREKFEQKLVPGGNSGCEDPRLTKLDDTVYMCYTAYDGQHVPRVALSSIDLNDLLAHNWTWSKPILISPPDIMDKDAAIFPRKVKGKYAFLHRIGSSIWLDYVDDLDFKKGRWLKGTVIMGSSQEDPPVEKIGIASPPIETKYGWLLLYHLVSVMEVDEENSQLKYYLSAALLDTEDPSIVIARRKVPLLEPETQYEKVGQVLNVVFPGGAAVINKRLFVYYGGADTVIGVASMPLSDLLQSILLSGTDKAIK